MLFYSQNIHVNKNVRKTKQNEHFEFPGIDFEFLSETSKSAQWVVKQRTFNIMPPSAHIHFEFPGTAFEFLSDAPNAIPAHPNNDFEFIHPVWVNIILKGIGMSTNPQRSFQSVVLGPVTQTGQLHVHFHLHHHLHLHEHMHYAKTRESLVHGKGDFWVVSLVIHGGLTSHLYLLWRACTYT